MVLFSDKPLLFNGPNFIKLTDWGKRVQLCRFHLSRGYYAFFRDKNYPMSFSGLHLALCQI